MWGLEGGQFESARRFASGVNGTHGGTNSALRVIWVAASLLSSPCATHGAFCSYACAKKSGTG